MRCYQTADKTLTRASAIGQCSLLLAVLSLLALLLLPAATFPLAAAAACRLGCAGARGDIRLGSHADRPQGARKMLMLGKGCEPAHCVGDAVPHALVQHLPATDWAQEQACKNLCAFITASPILTTRDQQWTIASPGNAQPMSTSHCLGVLIRLKTAHIVRVVLPTHTRGAGGSTSGHLGAESNLAEGGGEIADNHNVRQGEGIIDKVGAALQPLLQNAQRLGQPHLFRRRGLQRMAGSCVSRGLAQAELSGVNTRHCKTLHTLCATSNKQVMITTRVTS